MKDEDSIDFNETAMSDEDWAALLKELDEEYNKLGLNPVETVTLTYNGEALEWDGNLFSESAIASEKAPNMVGSDGPYDPQSTVEDYIFPHPGTGRGSLVETLPDTEESAYERAMKVIK